MNTAMFYVFMTDVYYQGSRIHNRWILPCYMYSWLTYTTKVHVFITDEYCHVICIHDWRILPRFTYS